MLAAHIRTDFLGWLRFPLWSGFEVFIIEQEVLAQTLLSGVLHNCQQSIGLTALFTYSVALNPVRSLLSIQGSMPTGQGLQESCGKKTSSF